MADFCRRWGRNYRYMIVLDADSIMTGDCLLQMTRAMQANPRAGLIQTVPIPVRQTTFFGRFVQFAAVLYSPMLATGLAFWQTNAANYWGHNAIIRVRPFLGPGEEARWSDEIEPALLTDGVWAFETLVGDGMKCPDGSWGSTTETVKFDDRTLSGVVDTSVAAGFGDSDVSNRSVPHDRKADRSRFGCVS